MTGPVRLDAAAEAWLRERWEGAPEGIYISNADDLCVDLDLDDATDPARFAAILDDVVEALAEHALLGADPGFALHLLRFHREGPELLVLLDTPEKIRLAGDALDPHDLTEPGTAGVTRVMVAVGEVVRIANELAASLECNRIVLRL